jgi:hypothetical protein
VARAGDEPFGIGLQRDVVELGKSAHGYPFARQSEACNNATVGAGEDDLRPTL